MAQTIGRGATITLDAFYRDGTNSLVDPDTPEVSIIDSDGATVANLATPDRLSVGHYQYLYPVDSGALLGAWIARWFGVINGDQVGPIDDGFTVVLAGSITTEVANGVTCSPWTTIDNVACSDLDPTVVARSIQVASDVLFNLSGRQYPGICHDYLRPTARFRQASTPRWWAAVGSRPAQGYCSCNRSTEYGCASIPEISLPNRQVIAESIVVRINGTSYDNTDGIFRLDDGHRLVRTDGSGWPCCQDLRADDATDDHTFAIEYDYGQMPPVGGIEAAASLACQIALARVGSDACQLLPQVKTATRQGITIEIADPATLFQNGTTGLPDVDLWLSSLRVGRRARRARVMVPGTPSAGRRPAR